MNDVAATLEAEAKALRTGAGAFLAARDVIAVRGAQAEEYLQSQLSQDIGGLGVGQADDSLLLQPDGKLVALLRVTRLTGADFLLDVEAGFGGVVVERLTRFLLRTKVEMERLDWRCLSLRGASVDEAGRSVRSALAEAGVLELPFEWNGWRGVDLLGPADVVVEPSSDSGVTPCRPAVVEACRIVSGLPAMGAELGDKTIAAEAGLVERAVSFTKGCYTGQELVARIDARGSNVARRLVGVRSGDDPEVVTLSVGMTLHAGDEVADVAADKVVGAVTSAAWSPELGAWVGLGYLHRSVAAPGPVRLRSGDGTGASRRAEVRTLPF